MTTLKERARVAAATLQRTLQIAPDNYDADQTAAIVEQALKNSARERDSLARHQVREAQTAAQERFARLLSSSPAVIYSFKATGDFAPTFVSDNIIAVFGYAPTEYLKDPSFWRDQVHPDDLARVETEIAGFFQNGVHTVEYRFRRKDGSYCWVNDEQHLIRSTDGKPLEIVGSWSDISKRKAAEEAKAAAHSRLSLLLACSPAVIYSYKAAEDFAPTFVSENITEVLGYQPREYLQNADFWRRQVHPEDLAAVEASIVQLFKTSRLTAEYRFLKKDGAYCWVSDDQRLIRDHNGQPIEVIGSWSDVSERKQAEEAAAATRDRVERLLASSPAVLYSYKATGDYAPTFISSNVKDLLAYDREEYLESADFWLNRVHPEDCRRVLREYSRLMEHGRLSVEYRFRKKDGAYCWIGDELHLVRNAAGEPTEVVGSWSDITARKQIGEALVAAQDRIGHLLSAAPAVIYSYKATGDFAPTFISQNIKDLFDYDPQEYLESADFQISERKTAEDGTVAVYTDITAIKNAEEEIREANRKAELANALINEQKRALEVLSTKLSKYLSPQVYSSIFTGRREVEIASSRKKLTVFFSDIADFTATTDDLESEELTGLLNHYLTEMSKIALEHGATIDKYIGDAIVAFFGDPESRGVKEDALACVSMAIAMQRRLRELQSDWRDSGMERPFQLRIGVNTGYCTVGNFGSEDRMDYTIIGSPVNLAARLQSYGEPGSILLSHETYSLVKEAIRAEEQASIQVKGFSKPIRNYKVVAQLDNPSDQTPVMREEQAGLRIFMDLQKLDKARAVAALKGMLSRLES